MRNILIVNAVFPPEQVVSAQIGSALASKLANDGYNVFVLAPYPSRPAGFKFDDEFKFSNTISKKIHSDCLNIYRLPSFIFPGTNPLGRLRESISFGYHCYKFIVNAPDRLDKVYMNTWPLFGQLGVACACVKTNTPYIVHVQDIYPESLVNKLPTFIRGPFKALLIPIEKYVLKHAAKVVAISQNMRTALLQTRKIKAEILVVYNWQDDAEFVNEVPIKQQTRFNFMYLGNIGPVAGIPFLIKSFQQAALTNSRLTIAGQGSKKQECIEIAKVTPQLDIQFVDVPAGAVPLMQSQADVLLLPVIKGGALSSIPSKLPAYMLSAKPILAALDRESDSAIAIRSARCGWVGDPDDVLWMAKKMEEISKFESSSLAELGANGRDYCLHNFSKKNNLEKLSKLITND